MDARGSDSAVKLLGGLAVFGVIAIVLNITGLGKEPAQTIVTPTPTVSPTPASSGSSTYDRAIADLDAADAQLDALKKDIDGLDALFGTQKDLDDATTQLNSIQ